MAKYGAAENSGRQVISKRGGGPFAVFKPKAWKFQGGRSFQAKRRGNSQELLPHWRQLPVGPQSGQISSESPWNVSYPWNGCFCRFTYGIWQQDVRSRRREVPSVRGALHFSGRYSLTIRLFVRSFASNAGAEIHYICLIQIYLGGATVM